MAPWDPAGYFNRALARLRLADAGRPGDFAREPMSAELTERLRAVVDDLDRALDMEPTNLRAFLTRGFVRRRLNELDGALADYDAAIALDRDHAPAWNLRAHVRAAKGDLAGAVADHEHALTCQPDDPATLNQLAWLYSTGRDPAVRNPARALELAFKACYLTEERDPGFLDTLAAAQAAAGRFAEAVATQEKAIALIPESDAAMFRVRAELYRSGVPYIDLGET
jgi:tetratricopeptide (TPR) repeat protein